MQLKIVRLSLLFVLLMPALVSCSLLLHSSPPVDIRAKLVVKYSSRRALIGKSTVVEGQVTNTHCRKVEEVRLTAKCYDAAGTLRYSYPFNLGVGLSPNGLATFKERFYVDQNDAIRVVVEVSSARD